MGKRTIHNNLGTFILREDGIIHITPIKNSIVTEEVAKEVVKIVNMLSENKLHPLIIDNREVSSIDRKGRQVFADDKNNVNISAVALVIGSPLSSVIVNFFIGLSKLSKPVKSFLSTTDAISWLKNYL